MNSNHLSHPVPRRRMRVLTLSLLLGLPAAACLADAPDRRDPGLVDIQSLAPDVAIEMRYATDDNFVGAVVDGYEARRCLLSPPAAAAIAAAQGELRVFGLSLVMFDCYRPQRAVDHFVRWSTDPKDLKTRARYYPNEDKAQMFDRGYIDRRSGHSRASTVDVGLREITGSELDMGTGWDFMDPLSATENPEVSDSARRNRLLLRSVMATHGFSNYAAEWWHFTLVQEPWPETYFDVPVR